MSNESEKLDKTNEAYENGMTYHNNDVTLKCSNGIAISGGSFKTSGLKISKDQDPKGKNKVGQVYQLNNNQFTFEVGRSGSEDVAQWFNTKVGASHTTFNHEAGKLNFAFIGDLTLRLKGDDIKNEVEITFQGVAFAQGHAGGVNNWWFGGVNAQHVVNKDAVLCKGADNQNNQYSAIFYRGTDNDYRKVEIQALKSGPKDKCVKVNDILKKFESITADAIKLETLSNLPISYDPTVNHVQGYTKYQRDKDYFILTHSVWQPSHGHIVTGQMLSEKVTEFDTYGDDWKHPGGIQTIGDYLLVPNEKGETENPQALISMYDLRFLNNQVMPRIESFEIYSKKHKAGCLGITNYTDKSDGKEYYILLIGFGSTYYTYKADAGNGLASAKFAYENVFYLENEHKREIDCQGFGLVTESETEKIYMVALITHDPGSNETSSNANEDWAYLVELNQSVNEEGKENFTPKIVKSIHLYNKGGLPGTVGIHFRFGAGISVDNKGKLVLLATARNIVPTSSELDTNYWISQ